MDLEKLITELIHHLSSGCKKVKFRGTTIINKQIRVEAVFEEMKCGIERNDNSLMIYLNSSANEYTEL